MLAGLTAFGCGTGDGVSPAPSGNLQTLPFGLVLNHPAVTLAAGQTLQLVAAPEKYDGTTFATPSTSTITWQSNDTSIVTVDQDGTLHARGTGSGGTFVIVTLVDLTQNVSFADTATVNVTATPQTVSRIDILHPPQEVCPFPGYCYTPPALTAAMGVGQGGGPLPTALDADGNVVPGIAISLSIRSFRTPSPIVFSGTYVYAVDTGQVMLYAHSFNYGVEQDDSVLLTAGLPYSAQVTAYDRTYFTGIFGTVPQLPLTSGQSVLFFPQNITIRQGGTVTFGDYSTFPGGKTLDMTFDDSTQFTPSQNITFVPQPCIAYSGGSYCPLPPAQPRTFPNVGTFHWHSVLANESGTVTVVP